MTEMLHLSRETKDYHYLGKSNSTSTDRMSFEETVVSAAKINIIHEGEISFCGHAR